ncbi:peptidoglycan-binding domain-containing protein [Metabacillus malikii]|uniref:Peptidoglycan binding-like domain-containing protein n=1 Tax=Metabacillus malikii TaxID=1504265 RepID=A0ABT9ZJM3_9BACI|nr:peptidoglycan-binding domain-containing protein [Metabacillus malikii]MDQ0232486.1 hypothetical protein [Metabacillus malikii]
MGKYIIRFIIFLLVLGYITGQAAAEENADVPSQSYSDQGEVRMQAMRAATNHYVRAFSCNGKSAWTSNMVSETLGYNWIMNQGWKGYIQQGASGGQTLGVVLNDTKIDFSFTYTVKKNNSANNTSYVKGVQAVLSCLGYDPGPTDGIFGTKTDAAVRAFQRNKGLTVDGIVGQKTYHYLSFASS